MMRTPRCRLAAVKYLDRKIPKLITDVDENRIHIAKYNLVIKNGAMQLEECTKNPEWFKQEKEMLSVLLTEADNMD